MWMTRVSINHPVFATMVMVGLTVLGLFSYQRLGVEPMPDVAPPGVQIWTTYPGASPEQVEVDVSKPIENAANTVAGVKRILSRADEGRALTWVEFRQDVDMTRATQELRDKLAQIRASFPRDVKDPIVNRVNGENDEPVATFALAGKDLTQRQLTLLAEQVVQKGFERVSGVGRVALSGTVTREIQVRVDPGRLTAYGLSVDQVVAALRAANVSVPVGTIHNATSESIVRVDGRLSGPAQFEKIIVARRAGIPILLGQVAQVLDTERERTSITRINGQPAIGVQVFKAQDANIVQVGRELKLAATEMQKQLPAGVELRFMWATSDFVASSVDNVKRTILEGGLLTVLIVFLFLGSWRSTVITGLTLPIAVIATFTPLYMLGFTLNYMTLMALSLCIGLLIDDAIVVRENIVRHIQMGKDHVTAARDGTEEIGLAVLATTFSIVAVFVPIAFMQGVVGKFFYPFGITVVAAVLLSLFVSFTLDPMLSAVWRDPPEGARGLPVVGPILRRFDAGVERLHGVYDRALRWALGHRKTTLALATLSFVASLPIAGFVGGEMMPEVDQSYTSIRLTMPVGSSLDYANERVKRVEEALREFPEIKTVDTSIGADGARNTATLALQLAPRSERRRDQKAVEKAVRARVAAIPGVELSVGWNRPIYVALLGNNDAEMNRVIAELKERVAKIPGIADVETSVKEGTPALRVRLKPELAAEYGITHAQLGTTLRAMVGGENSGYWLAPDGQNYEVVTQLPQAARTVGEDIVNLNIATGRQLADGTPEVVPLRAVATVERIFNPENIRRQDLQRRVALFAGVENRAAGDVGEDVQKVVKAMELPPGLRFDVGGQIREQQEVSAAILGALVLAIVFIYLVLASQFGSFLQPVAIMASLPLSIVGVMLALLVTKTTLNIFSMIGVVFLMGLVTKNAILLVDFANKGQREGLSREEALLAAGQVRLRPILMTTAAMVFGMLPLALGLGEGAEQQAPMGRAIIGGVITSTLLTLIVVPVVYTWLDAWEQRFKARRRAHGTHGAAVLDHQPSDRLR
ncbi:MAG TPA: efflux RND transporter permease subunit [Burkholderiaceae bacterium]|nr:efflux RND transporter permease subunit [Burkholderiaceae bacterium]HPE02173.1 efflux RND transporter permease subunit [Burkholderiaceae bacterium]HRZ01510.1 efflux RND transporter permease subunit [Burkholderiaceae bacterium]